MFQGSARTMVRLALVLVAAATVRVAPGQEQAQQPVYAPQPGYVAPEFATANVPVAAPPRTSMRDLFAGTLATVAHISGTTLVAGLTQAIAGGLTDWFSRKLKVQPGVSGQPPAYDAASTMPAYATPGYVPPAYPQDAQSPPVYTAPAYPQDAQSPPVYSTPAYPQGAQSPSVYAAPAYPQDPAMPSAAGTPLAMPGSVPAYGDAPQYFDPRTGLATSAVPAFGGPSAGGVAMDGALFAGLAYEVHAIDSMGNALAVNPATHEFRTGDRFVMHYRPALPGRMDVYNINPAGRRTQIDSVELAAGQLATLGPYEFVALTGDEQLQLVLRPCSTPELVLVTRDIVNVSGPVEPTAGPGLAVCGPATRSMNTIATRDIRKVALEGMTGFALDPVDAQELATGQLAARQLTVSFRHR